MKEINETWGWRLKSAFEDGPVSFVRAWRTVVLTGFPRAPDVFVLLTPGLYKRLSRVSRALLKSGDANLPPLPLVHGTPVKRRFPVLFWSGVKYVWLRVSECVFNAAQLTGRIAFSASLSPGRDERIFQEDRLRQIRVMFQPSGKYSTPARRWAQPGWKISFSLS